MNYTAIQSAYLKEKLTSTLWANRSSLDDLICLHRYLKTGGAKSFAGALQYHALKQRYPQEFLSLLKEQSPEAYQAHLQKTVREEEALWEKTIAEQEEALRTLKAEREDWFRVARECSRLKP